MNFWEEFKRPFNIVTLTLAVVGVVLAYYFYHKDHRFREIDYNLLPVSKIFDKTKATPAIKLVEKDTIPIKDNVYLIAGTIWNNGNTPISKEDIRKQLSIKLADCKRILDFNIVKQNDSALAKFTLNKKDDNSLNIDWAYFDPKFGFTFQIIYIGSEDPHFCLEGKILDIEEFKNMQTTQNSIWVMALFIVIAAASLSCIKLFWMLFERLFKPITKTNNASMLSLIAFFLSFILVGLLFWFSLKFVVGAFYQVPF